MEALRNPIILTCIVLYMGTCIAIGLWALGRTNMSGFGFVGGPGLVYSMGMSSVWIVISATINGMVAAFLVSKRLRLFAGLYDTVSLPDAAAARYGSESTRLLTAFGSVGERLGPLSFRRS